METQIVKTTVYEVYNEFGSLCGRYSDRDRAYTDICEVKRSLSPLALATYRVEEKTIETTYEVVYKKFRKNSRFEWYRGQVVKFLVKNGHTIYSEKDGKLDRCSYDYL